MIVSTAEYYTNKFKEALINQSQCSFENGLYLLPSSMETDKSFNFFFAAKIIINTEIKASSRKMHLFLMGWSNQTGELGRLPVEIIYNILNLAMSKEKAFLKESNNLNYTQFKEKFVSKNDLHILSEYDTKAYLNAISASVKK